LNLIDLHSIGEICAQSAQRSPQKARQYGRECAPDDLVRNMVSESFDPAIARALVDEFILARDQRRSIVADNLTLTIPGPEYRHEGARISSGNMIRAEDRTVLVLLRLERPVIAALDKRISLLMNSPVDNGEGLQILRYGPGTQSTPHFDFLIPSNEANRQSLAHSGQRISSLVVYLNDVAAGGETKFPEIGLSVSPKKGNAVYFEYCNSLGQVDSLSLHAEAPVIAGEKWAATKWMRQRRFVPAWAARSLAASAQRPPPNSVLAREIALVCFSPCGHARAHGNSGLAER
jgi:hypothetical protein